MTLNSQGKSIRDDDGGASFSYPVLITSCQRFPPEKARNEKILPSESSLSPSPPTEDEDDDEGKEENSNEDKEVIPDLPKTSQVSVSGQKLRTLFSFFSDFRLIVLVKFKHPTSEHMSPLDTYVQKVPVTKSETLGGTVQHQVKLTELLPLAINSHSPMKGK